MKKILIIAVIFVLFSSFALAQHIESKELIVVKGNNEYIVNTHVGETTRFLFANSPKGIPLQLSVEGTKFKVLGYSDELVSSVTIPSGEIRTMEAVFTKPGTYLIENQGPEKITRVGKIVVEERKNVFEIIMEKFL
jgi:hypothetical protein